MRSDLPPDEFYKKVRDRQGETKDMVTLEGVTIGHTANSTTVVPKVYSMAHGNLHVCDMPGWAETDPQKKISISVLQKCFLTRVKGATFLAVLDIGACFDVRPQTIVDNYHKPLLDLLGDKYDSAIDHLCFILTKNDGVDAPRKTEDELEVQLMRWGKEMTRAKFDQRAVQLLYRILDRHVFVDLTVDTKEDVLNKIQDLIEKDQREREQLNRVARLKIEHLEAGENELNRLSHAHCISLLERLKQVVTWFGQTDDENGKHKLALRAECDALKAHKETIFTKASQLATELKEVLSAIDSFEPETRRTEEAIKETEALLAMHQKQSKLFQKSLVDEDFINVRCDLSREVTRRGKKCYNSKLNIDVESDCSKDRVVLAMDYEPKDETLKSYINRNGSLIPKSIKHIGQIDMESVLYNNVTQRNKCLALVDQRRGVLSIEITRDTPFKIYIYSARKLTEMDLWRDFRERFDEDLRNDEAKIRILQQKLVTLREKHQTDVKRKFKLEETLARAQAELDGCKEGAKAMQTAHSASCTTMLNALQHIEEKRLSIEGDPSVENVATIEKIFRENNIQNDLASAIRAFHDINTKLTTDLTSSKEVVEMFLEAQNELIQDLLVSRWNVAPAVV